MFTHICNLGMYYYCLEYMVHWKCGHSFVCQGAMICMHTNLLGSDMITGISAKVTDGMSHINALTDTICIYNRSALSVLDFSNAHCPKPRRKNT